MIVIFITSIEIRHHTLQYIAANELDMKEAKLFYRSAMQPITAIPVYLVYFQCCQL